MASTGQHSARVSPQIITRVAPKVVPIDPIVGEAQFQVFVGGAVLYQVFVFNGENQDRFFTMYNSSAALDQGESILFPWTVPPGEHIEINFPKGIYLDQGCWCALSRDADELEVDPGDTMRILFMVRADQGTGELEGSGRTILPTD